MGRRLIEIIKLDNTTVQIKTTKDISREILTWEGVVIEEDFQGEFTVQRQTDEEQEAFSFLQKTVLSVATTAFQEALSRGITEAEVLLPEGLTLTTLTVSAGPEVWQGLEGPIATKCKEVLDDR